MAVAVALEAEPVWEAEAALPLEPFEPAATVAAAEPLEPEAETVAAAAELAAKEGLSDVEAERRVFQTSHAELGAYVMALWNIPDPIVEAIAYHHASAAAMSLENPVLTAVHAAELACR